MLQAFSCLILWAKAAESGWGMGIAIKEHPSGTRMLKKLFE